MFPNTVDEKSITRIHLKVFNINQTSWIKISLAVECKCYKELRTNYRRTTFARI